MLLFIFDFDNTLGDTYWPYGEGNIFRTKTLPGIEKATEIYEKYRRWPNNIVVYPKLLEEYGITNPREFFINAGLPNQLYDDVTPFFIKLREYPEIKTTILTTGDEDFQHLKVDITGADKLVDEVFVTRKRNKAENIREIIQKYQPEHTIFIDDHINITPADFDTPITIYDMNRARTKKWEFVIHELSELPLDKILWTK